MTSTQVPGVDDVVIRPISPGGMGAEPVAVDVKDGKILRIRPMRYDMNYTEEELADKLWSFESHGRTIFAPVKTRPPYFALSYKKREYSKNRVLYPLKRVDWEPGGDPDKINAQNRGKSKFVRISWDEACEIVLSEVKRIKEKYGQLSVMAVGEDGHKESKVVHGAGGWQANLLSHMGGYTREVRTPDSVEGFYWGAKHVWGPGAQAIGVAGPECFNVVKDVTDNSELIVLQSGDLETTQNFHSMSWSYLVKEWLAMGKRIVSIDPFCNYTNVIHDDIKWIPVLPNTDSALDFALMYVWITEDLYNKEYVETHTTGFDKLKAYVLGEEDGIPKTPEWAAPLCGVPEWTIKALARDWGSKPTTISHFCGAHSRGPWSHEIGRTEAYKLAMQGLGGPGVHQLHMWAFYTAKQEIKNVAGELFLQAAMRNFMFMPAPQQIPRTQTHWAINEGHAETWGSTQIILEPVEDQFVKYEFPAPTEQGGCEIRMVWSEKPCNQGCWNGGFYYQEAMRNPKLECVVTNHQWLENDSLFADIVLPVTCVLEEQDCMGSGFNSTPDMIGIQHPAIAPRGESKSDYEIAIEMAKHLGIEDEITGGLTIDEWIEYAYDMSLLPDEISLDDLREKQYYIPKLDPEWQDLPPGLREFYDDPEGHPLETASGKLDFYSDAIAEHFPDDIERGPLAKWVPGGSEEEGYSLDERLGGERSKKYPFLLVANPGRWRLHVQGDDVTWFREIPTCKVDGPDGYKYEPVWICPEDAEALGIADGDIVKVFNEEGIILGGAKISERMLPHAIMMNKGARVDPIATRIDRGGSTNLISSPKPLSKNCWGFSVTGFLVGVEKLSNEEMEQWKKDYPDAFARDYDPGVGINYDSWVIGEE